MQGFGKIAKPLTNMLKKDNFQWSDSSTATFQRLKIALITTPVLALPNFAIPFVVETIASGSGIGAILMQANHPIAFISKSLGVK